MPQRRESSEDRDVAERDRHGIPGGSSLPEEERDPLDVMHDRVKADLKAWKEGLERSFPLRRR